MTVRDWLRDRSAGAPESLVDQILEALGSDGDAPEPRAADACLAAAARLLEALLSDRRFERSSAVDLLTIDALMTYAFEHAAVSGATHEELDSLTRRGAHMVGRLAVQRV